MADSTLLPRLLDQAQKVFAIVGNLGQTFQQEQLDNVPIVPGAWKQHASSFNALCQNLENLSDAMLKPPVGFEQIANELLVAAQIAKSIRDVMKTRYGNGFSMYREKFPELITQFEKGHRAVNEAKKKLGIDDPLSFLDRVEIYTVGQLISDLRSQELDAERAGKQSAKMKGLRETSELDSFYQVSAIKIANDSRAKATEIAGQPGVAHLQLICEAIPGARWSSDWLVQKRAEYCLSCNIDKATVDAMAVVKFAEQLGEDDDCYVISEVNANNELASPGSKLDENDDEIDDRTEVFATINPSKIIAYLSYEYAESKREEDLKDQEAYDYLKEFGYEDNEKLENYDLPSYETWGRYVREVRTALGRRKNQPRSGRTTGSSVVNRSDL